MKKGNLSEDTDKEYFENGEMEDCLNQQSNVYVTKQGQLGKMDGSQLEFETVKRQVEDEFQGEFGENAATEIQTVEIEDTAENEDMLVNEVESVPEEIVNVEEVNNNVIESVDDTTHNLNGELRKIVERRNEIMLEGKHVMALCLRK